MSPKRFQLVAAALLAASLAFEATLLAGVNELGDDAYHLVHLALIGVLAGSQFGLYLYGRRHGIEHRFALLFALGLTFTGVGDFVNSAVSGVEPVSLKLSWALLLFGLGYTLYSIALWTYNETKLRGEASAFARRRYLIALPILALNVAAWFQHVEPNLAGHDLLYYGSFVFNATIYVALPTFAVWFFYNSGYSIGGLAVLVGAIFVPYSDLVLFASWLQDGDPAVPIRELYAYNWLVYFSGQALISLAPSLALSERMGATEPLSQNDTY